jgi:heat shock protein HslJ
VETAEMQELEGTRWVLADYLNAAGETVAALPDAEATAEFNDGQLAGQGSCNRFFGSYTVDGNALTVDGIGSTMMACMPETLMQQEADFLANLGAAATYTIEGTQLMIANADGVVTLTFEASEPISLTNTNWVATSFNNGREAVVSLLADTTITADFAEDGTLSGTSSCNTYTTTYTVDGEVMTIGETASTMMLCSEPEGVMEQEAQYLAALATTATFQIDGNTLTLRDANGAMVANYTVGEAMP